MVNKTQVFFIHGGMTHKSKDDYLEFLKNRNVSIDKKISWSDEYLDRELGDEFHVIHPRMPLKDFSQYDEWKIHFERFFSLLEDGVILIGNSLGGMFLAKYLSENKFPKKILSVYMVCPPFDGTLSKEDLAGGFELGDDLSMITENCDNVRLLFSKDDDVVPVSHAEKYREKLPEARIEIFESMNGHFLISEFPEIVEMIKSDVKSK